MTLKCKDIDLIKVSEILNNVNPEAEVSSIVLSTDDYQVNFSLSFSNLYEYNREMKIRELQQIIKEYESA